MEITNRKAKYNYEIEDRNVEAVVHFRAAGPIQAALTGQCPNLFPCGGIENRTIGDHTVIHKLCGFTMIGHIHHSRRHAFGINDTHHTIKKLIGGSNRVIVGIYQRS